VRQWPRRYSHISARTIRRSLQVAMLFEAARDFERAAEHFPMAARQAPDISANKEAAALGLQLVWQQQATEVVRLLF
jgi:hypothetical protein